MPANKKSVETKWRYNLKLRFLKEAVSQNLSNFDSLPWKMSLSIKTKHWIFKDIKILDLLILQIDYTVYSGTVC